MPLCRLLLDGLRLDRLLLDQTMNGILDEVVRRAAALQIRICSDLVHVTCDIVLRPGKLTPSLKGSRVTSHVDRRFTGTTLGRTHRAF